MNKYSNVFKNVGNNFVVNEDNETKLEEEKGNYKFLLKEQYPKINEDKYLIKCFENEENAKNADLMKFLLMKEQTNQKDNDEKRQNKPDELFDFFVNSSLSISSFESAQNSTSILRYDNDLYSDLKPTLISMFIDEIRDTIKIMKEILYAPPYSILFGRMSIIYKKPKQKNMLVYKYQKPINYLFYEGFGIEI